jgi:hypothetical protein
MNMSVPNQRIVKVHRDMPGKKEGNFLLIKKGSLYEAYRTLNATALCLYLYLAANKEGYNLEFSPKAIHTEMGIPESTCRDQFKVLVQKGYLVPKHEGSNIYDFYERPQKKS